LAHVQPQGATFDELDRGAEERQSNLSEVSEDAASKSLEVLRQITSPGYLRNRVPQNLTVLQGGQSAAMDALDAALPDAGGAGMAATIAPSTANPATAAVPLDARAKAKMQGYEGEACGECGNYTLVRNGTCMKCNTCGGTSGCS